MSDFLANYIEGNIVCLIIFSIMLARDLFSGDRQEKQIKFDHALVAFMLYFVSDSLWAAVLENAIPKTVFTVVAANLLNFILMAAMTYAWLIYVMAAEQVVDREKRSKKLLLLLPFILSLVVLTATYIFAPQVLLDESLKPKPMFLVYQVFTPIANIIMILFYALRRAKHEVNPDEKKRHISIGLFPLIVIIGGLTQVSLLPNTSIFCFACAILMLIIYLQSMQTQISIDPLTGLNNRGQFTKYISQESNAHKEGLKTFVIMIDINDFKSINDTYGHSEGDRALIMVANSLKSVINGQSMPAFLGRYGGDEFVIVIHLSNSDEIEKLKAEIRERIKTECSEGEAEYGLTVGVGYDELTPDGDTFSECIERADKKLYIDKENCKKNGDAAFARRR